jgi:hypothetical protein
MKLGQCTPTFSSEPFVFYLEKEDKNIQKYTFIRYSVSSENVVSHTKRGHLRVSDNSVEGSSGTKAQTAPRNWRKFHNEEHNNFYLSPDISSVIDEGR